MNCAECDRHERAQQSALADPALDQAYVALNLMAWIEHVKESHL